MNLGERQKLIKTAREAGFSDTDILKEVLRGVRAGNKRREMVVEWGALLGLDANAALRLARAATLIPTTAPPRGNR